MSLGLIIIVFSPTMGGNSTNLPMMFTGILVVILGGLMVFLKKKKDKKS
ncbi:LPXTG cell wall anchor domain-containing protein [Listeria newyorkensis]